jgi:hypothetical protein
MVAAISPDPRLQFFANDGSFLVGGKLYTYAAGTTTPLATYTSSTGGTANTNPVILDSRGEASVWLGSSKYKFVLKNANDVEVWTQDNLQAGANVDGSNATGTWPISITGNAATATLAATATYATTAGSVTPGVTVDKIIAGTNITISPGTGVGNVTINAASAGGTVTSVSGAGTSGFTLTGGPITTSGTLTVTPPAPSTAGNVLTSDGTNWVSSAPSGTTYGGVGSYLFGVPQYNITATQGSTVSGIYSGALYPISNSNSYVTLYLGTLASGTWRCMGSIANGDNGGGSNYGAALFVRIA